MQKWTYRHFADYAKVNTVCSPRGVAAVFLMNVSVGIIFSAVERLE